MLCSTTTPTAKTVLLRTLRTSSERAREKNLSRGRVVGKIASFVPLIISASSPRNDERPLRDRFFPTDKHVISTCNPDNHSLTYTELSVQGKKVWKACAKSAPSMAVNESRRDQHKVILCLVLSSSLSSSRYGSGWRCCRSPNSITVISESQGKQSDALTAFKGCGTNV